MDLCLLYPQALCLAPPPAEQHIHTRDLGKMSQLQLLCRPLLQTLLAFFTYLLVR